MPKGFVSNLYFQKILNQNPRRKIEKGVEELFRDSVKAFIEAAVDTMSVDTGMSIASWLPLAEETDSADVVWAKASQSKGIKKGRFSINGTWNSQDIRSISEGILAGQEASRIVRQKQRWVMQFRVNVWQYHWHESAVGSTSQSWKSLLAGKIAQRQYIRDHVWEYLPSITKMGAFRSRVLRNG